MAQGKTKQKTKLPSGVKQKIKKSGKKNSGFIARKRKEISNFACNAFSSHQNNLLGAPAPAKIIKIQQEVTKAVNKKNETEIKKRSVAEVKKLSEAQKAVAKHHEKSLKK